MIKINIGIGLLVASILNLKDLINKVAHSALKPIGLVGISTMLLEIYSLRFSLPVNN